MPSGWIGLTTELLLDPRADAGLGIPQGAAELDRLGADPVDAPVVQRGDGDAQVVGQLGDREESLEPGVGGSDGHGY